MDEFKDVGNKVSISIGGARVPKQTSEGKPDIECGGLVRTPAVPS